MTILKSLPIYQISLNNKGVSNSLYSCYELFKVAPRVEEIEVFKKGLKFAIRICLRVALWKNIVFLWANELHYEKTLFFMGE